MSRRGLVRAREKNWKSDRLAGILPGKPDFVKVEWEPAAGSAPSIINAELSRFARVLTSRAGDPRLIGVPWRPC